MYKKILIAYDGSEQSRRALAQAKGIGQSFGSKLEIVHVYAYPSFTFGEALVTVPQNIERDNYDYAKRVTEEAEALTADVPYTRVTLLQGHPAKSIIDYADETHCDLIVIGSRGLGGIKEFVLGSVSHNVVQHAKVPILIVK